jgi:uncharacterized membrane protein YeaQ/YmgE (transglycosylase-associated protein family)
MWRFIMLDMNFIEFLTLLVVSVISSVIVHYGYHHRSLQGSDGFFFEWIVGWIFAWLGSPVFGHWFANFHVQNIYLIPALLGGFVGAFCAAVVWREIRILQKSTT